MAVLMDCEESVETFNESEKECNVGNVGWKDTSSIKSSDQAEKCSNENNESDDVGPPMTSWFRNCFSSGQVKVKGLRVADKIATSPREEQSLCSFIEALKDSVRKNEEKVFASWYDSKGCLANSYTFKELWQEAGFVSHFLRLKRNIQKGDRVILCYSPGLQFYAAFLGCLRAGVVAIPVYPPDTKKMVKSIRKMNLIYEDCEAKLVLVDSAVNSLLLLGKVRHRSEQMKCNRAVHPKTPAKPLWPTFDEPSISEQDLAFLQYTSGSTGDPKGVMITFEALHENCKNSLQALSDHVVRIGKSKEDIVGFSWLPQYHDMGLVFATIAPLIGGWRCNMISPLDFIANPCLWIELMSKLRVNWSIAPNFAYQLTARKLTERKKKNPSYGTELDLSSVIQLGCAAEPIQRDIKSLFEEAFADVGLKGNWFCAGYGLAESVACVSTLHKLKLSSENQLVAVAKRSCISNQVIKIVCPKNKVELSDGNVGEIWVSGPSVAKGYWGKPNLTAETFHAKIISSAEQDIHFLRTGDLGFFEDDYLYVCGREKDLIIVNGANHYPQDIEHTVEKAHDGVRPGCIAAFSSDDTGASGDLEIIFEVRKNHEKEIGQIVAAVHAEVKKNVELTPTRVVAIKERSIFKTTSGKIQRRENRRALHGGEFKKQTLFDSSRKEDNTTNVRDLELEATGRAELGPSTLDEKFNSVLESFFGNDTDLTSSWEDIGMTSTNSVSFRNELSHVVGIDLDLDCFATCRTPSSLKEFIHEMKGDPLEISRSDVVNISSIQLPWSVISTLQFFGSLLILFILSACIVFAFCVGALISSSTGSSTLKWLIVPLSVPVWMISFSVAVIFLKWSVVGKYREGKVNAHTLFYYRWWLVDRALDLWEKWIGKYIVGTCLLNLFYALMGTAEIHPSVYFDAFIREFDLVTVGNNSTISCAIYCHKFGTFNEKGEAPVISFRKITIGKACAIKGIVSPGASVGDESAVGDLAFVPECAIIPSKSFASSNPATMLQGVVPGPSSPHCWWKVGILKCTWLVFEMYHFSAIIALGHWLWSKYVPCCWRYEIVTKWLILFMFFSGLSVLTSILVKWILVGKRRPGPRKRSLLQQVADDCADWHWSNLILLFCIQSVHSRLFWNTILFLHGMNVDIVSKLFADEFQPSTFDLIKIRRSFVSAVSFDTASEEAYEQVNVFESSIGLWCKLSNGASVVNKIVPPLTCVNNKQLVGSDNLDKRNEMRNTKKFDFASEEMIIFLLFYLNVSILLGSLVPSYELWLLISPRQLLTTAATIGLCLVLQAISFSVLLSLYESVAFAEAEKRHKPWSKVLYCNYQCVNWTFHCFTLASVFQGSPFYNVLMRILGSKFEGRAILFPHIMYDHCLLNFADKSVVDAAHIIGHYAVYNELTTGRSNISGTVQRGTVVANASLPNKESGPSRAYIGQTSAYNRELTSASDECTEDGKDDVTRILNRV